MNFSGDSEVKNPPAMQETQEIWVQFLGGENPLGQDFLSGESMDRRAWRATVHRVTKSWTQLRE